MSQPKEIGTLVVVVLKAQHLPQPSFYKQDPYAQVSLSGLTKRTKVDPKGGQHPVWDDELRFPVLADVGKDRVNRILEVACYKDEQRGEDTLLGKGKIDIDETLKTGEFDDWVPLETLAGTMRGEIYLEMTFYANGPPPLTRRPSKLTPSDRLKQPTDYLKQGQHQASNLSEPGSALSSQPARSAVTKESSSSPPIVTDGIIPASLKPARNPQNQTSKQAPITAKHADDPLPPLPVDKGSPVRSGINPGKKTEVPAALQAGGRSGPRSLQPHARNRLASETQSHRPDLHFDQPRSRTSNDTVTVHSPAPPPFPQAQGPLQVHGVAKMPSIVIEDDLEGRTPVAFPTPSLSGSVGYEMRGTFDPSQRPREYDAQHYRLSGQAYVQPSSHPYLPPAQGYPQTYSLSTQSTTPQPLAYTLPGQSYQFHDMNIPPSSTPPQASHQPLPPSTPNPHQQPQYAQYAVGSPSPQPPTYHSQPTLPMYPSEQLQPYPPQQHMVQHQSYVPQQRQYQPQQPTPQPYDQSNYLDTPPSGQTLGAVKRQQHPPLTYPQSPGPPLPSSVAPPQYPLPPSQSYIGAPQPTQTPLPPTSVPFRQLHSYFSPPPPPPPLLYSQGVASAPVLAPAAQVLQAPPPGVPSQMPTPPPSSSPQATPATSVTVPVPPPAVAQPQENMSALSQALSDSPPAVCKKPETEEREPGESPKGISVPTMASSLAVTTGGKEEEETRQKAEEEAERERQEQIKRDREDEERRVRQETERKQQEDEERQRCEEELRRQEEERSRQEAELRQQEELKRQEEERRKQEERRLEEERRRREEEEYKRREEEERMRREEEEHMRQEEERKRQEEERRMRQEEEERKRREEERRRQKEEIRKRREEEERLRREREEAERRRKAEEAEAERRWQEELARIKARAEQEAADAAFARAQFEAEEAERRKQEETDFALARRAQEEAEREERLARERHRQEEADMEVARREQAHEEELERRRREDRRRQIEEGDHELARKLDMELNLGTQSPGDQSQQRRGERDAQTRTPVGR